MSTLQERLAEVMAAMKWSQTDPRRESGQSHSVVSQWLGGSSKLIKSIGKFEAAEKLERATGFAALWIAKGQGPKHAPQTAHLGGTSGAHGTAENVALYATPEMVLDRLGALIAAAPEARREALATNLAGWARSGASSDYRLALVALLTPASHLSRKQA